MNVNKFEETVERTTKATEWLPGNSGEMTTPDGRLVAKENIEIERDSGRKDQRAREEKGRRARFKILATVGTAVTR